MIGEYISQQDNPGDWLFVGGFALAAFLLVVTQRQFRLDKLRREGDFQRTLSTLLLPKEKVKLVCTAESHGHWVLTGKRLLIQQGQSYAAVPLGSIKKVQGLTAQGKPTTVPEKAVLLTLTAEREYTLKSRDKAFPQLMKALRTRAAAERKKAAAKKAAGKKPVQKKKPENAPAAKKNTPAAKKSTPAAKKSTPAAKKSPKDRPGPKKGKRAAQKKAAAGKSKK